MKFEEAAERAKELAEKREEARTIAVRAIRQLESTISSSLGTERLRGLPNLGTREEPFYGIRIASNRAKASVLPIDGREVLVLRADGFLAFAWKFRGKVQTRSPKDEELRAENLEEFANAAIEALDRFVTLADRRIGKIETVERFARELIELTRSIFGKEGGEAE